VEDTLYAGAIDENETFEIGGVYSVRVGVTDSAVDHAIVSAMILVRNDGIEVFWTGAPEQREGG
jgi:hypothetical protein